MADIDIRTTGKVGRITLTRPAALNALNHEMSTEIEKALDRWRTADDIDMVLIDAEGGRAFCAGGDIAALYRQGSGGDHTAGGAFWRDEYRMNAKIDTFAKPYVAIMDGIVMGGGAGISVHGSHRIVTERSMVAMPECAIGLVPDVGCSLALARAPGSLGIFLALTGWRMNAADAIHAGFADIAIESADIPALTHTLETSADPADIEAFAAQPQPGTLEPHLDAIDRHFSKDTALACLLSLEGDDSPFATKAAAMIRRASPLSVAATFELVRRARSFTTVAEAVQLEYRFTSRSVRDSDILEGVRAQIIDKDRNPQWRHQRLEDVAPERVEAMLSLLGEEELVIRDGGVAS